MIPTAYWFCLSVKRGAVDPLITLKNTDLRIKLEINIHVSPVQTSSLSLWRFCGFISQPRHMQATWWPECVSVYLIPVMRRRPARDGPHLPTSPPPRPPPQPPSTSAGMGAFQSVLNVTGQDLCGTSAEVSVPASTSPSYFYTLIEIKGEKQILNTCSQSELKAANVLIFKYVFIISGSK